MALTGVMDGCAWCEEHKKNWSDPKFIRDGFKLTRTIEGLKELWLSLDKDRSGKIIRRLDDYSVRKGLCHKPVTTRELFHFTICHKVVSIFKTTVRFNSKLKEKKNAIRMFQHYFIY